MSLDGHAFKACTCFRADGKTLCGRYDDCTRVITRDLVGRTLHKHWVCREHRIMNELPEHGVIIDPRGMRPYRG